MAILRTDLQQSIVDLLRTRGNRLLSVAEIAQRLPDHDAPRELVERTVEELERDGIIVAVRGKRYSLLEFTPYHAGVIRVHPDGHGSLRGSDGDTDIHVDRRAIKGAMNGDLVVARVEKDRRKVGNREVLAGEVVRVLRRAHRTVVGRFHERERGGVVVPFDIRLDHDVAIDEGATLDAIEGEMVNVEIDRYPDRSSNVARGRIVERLGFIGDPGVDIEVVIRKFHIPHNFPPEVLAAADTVPLEVSRDVGLVEDDDRRHATGPRHREVALQAAEVEVAVQAGDEEGHVDVRGDDLLVDQVAGRPPARVRRTAAERGPAGEYGRDDFGIVSADRRLEGDPVADRGVVG